MVVGWSLLCFQLPQQLIRSMYGRYVMILLVVAVMVVVIGHSS